MVGSAVPTRPGSGAIEIRAMRKAGYRPETAASITAQRRPSVRSSCRSLPMVIYGVTADVSVGKLFMGGLIPGLLMGVALVVMVGFVARREGMGRIAFPGFRVLGKTFVISLLRHRRRRW